MTGASAGLNTAPDYATIKYNSAGQQQWVARYDGPPGSSDQATAIGIDGAGDVYVTGRSVGFGTLYDYATIKYDSAGQQQWVARYNGNAGDEDVATSMAVDKSGNVYVTGYSRVNLFSTDYATIKYASSGQEQWVARYNGPGNGDDYAEAIALDSSGNIYVTGWSLGSGTNYDYATIKYGQGPHADADTYRHCKPDGYGNSHADLITDSKSYSYGRVLSHSNGDVLADTNAERAAVSALWHTDGNRYFYSHSPGIQSNTDCNNASSKRDANYHAGSYADTI